MLCKLSRVNINAIKWTNEHEHFSLKAEAANLSALMQTWKNKASLVQAPAAYSLKHQRKLWSTTSSLSGQWAGRRRGSSGKTHNTISPDSFILFLSEFLLKKRGKGVDGDGPCPKTAFTQKKVEDIIPPKTPFWYNCRRVWCTTSLLLRVLCRFMNIFSSVIQAWEEMWPPETDPNDFPRLCSALRMGARSIRPCLTAC